MSATSFTSWVSALAPEWERQTADSLDTAVLRGSLEFLSLFDIIQWVCGSRRSWTIRVHGEGMGASVTVVEGDLTDARWGDLVGREALLEILSVERGHFELEPIGNDTPRTIEGNWTFALLSAAAAAEKRTAPLGTPPPPLPAPPRRPSESDDTLEVAVPDALLEPEREAHRSGPDLSKAHDLVDQGYAAIRCGDIDRARRIWQQALERDPENRVLKFNLRRLDTLSTASR